jgi:hypothetical protein
VIADTGGRDGRFADGADGRSADGAVRDGARRERATGRVWTVRLDPHGGTSSGTVRLTCSRPGCADQLLPDSAAGRRAATAHVNAHLARVRAGGGAHGDAWCGCRAADCAWHSSDVTAGQRAGAPPAAGAVRCGGPVALTVYADRAGRLWRVAEVCARCAAATRDCRVLDTAAHTRPDGRLGGAEDEGLDLGAVAAFCAVRREDVTEHAGLLITADWLSGADAAGGRLHGRLAERVLPRGGLL